MKGPLLRVSENPVTKPFDSVNWMLPTGPLHCKSPQSAAKSRLPLNEKPAPATFPLTDKLSLMVKFDVGDPVIVIESVSVAVEGPGIVAVHPGGGPGLHWGAGKVPEPVRLPL